MAPFRKILVPVDFSPHSEEALRVALTMARAFDASVTVATVFQPPIYALPEGAFIALPTVFADATIAATKNLEDLAEKARATSTIPITTKMLDGVPFHAIIGFARSDDFDLIVMGTHGRTGIRHALIGSVAEKVVRKAPCAVLTIRLPGHTFEHP
jgi:nucleotide-binding universal stress UspA family protein